jgi:hypothetical protein
MKIFNLHRLEVTTKREVFSVYEVKYIIENDGETSEK